jgi:PAS domain-containing protein
MEQIWVCRAEFTTLSKIRLCGIALAAVKGQLDHCVCRFLVRREFQIQGELSRVEAGSERAERLASLLTLSYEPMLVWDLNGPIEFWNSGAERLYGFTSAEAVWRGDRSAPSQ